MKNNMRIGNIMWVGEDELPTMTVNIGYKTQEHKGFITRFKAHVKWFDFDLIRQDDNHWQIILLDTMLSTVFRAESLELAKQQAERIVQEQLRICDRCNDWYFTDTLQTLWEDTHGLPLCSVHCHNIWEAYNEDLWENAQ